jgi:plasmid stabilization system protein ParE
MGSAYASGQTASTSLATDLDERTEQRVGAPRRTTRIGCQARALNTAATDALIAWISERSPEGAARLVARFEDAVAQLQKNPFVGVPSLPSSRRTRDFPRLKSLIPQRTAALAG